MTTDADATSGLAAEPTLPEGDGPSPFGWPRFSLGQLCLVVAVCALEFKLLTHAARLGGGTLAVAVFAQVIGFPALVGTAIASRATPGPRRDWLVLVCMSLPVVLILVPIALATVVFTVLALFALTGDASALGLFVVLGPVDLFLAWLLVMIVKELAPKRCPACGRRAVIRDRWAGEGGAIEAEEPVHWCWACGSHFVRRVPEGLIRINVGPGDEEPAPANALDKTGAETEQSESLEPFPPAEISPTTDEARET